MAYIKDIMAFGAETGVVARDQTNFSDTCLPLSSPIDLSINQTKAYTRAAVTAEGDAVLVNDFASDLIYDRIWATKEVDFGTITEDLQQYMYIWNAFLSQKIMTAVDDPGDEGVDIAYDAPPFTFEGNEEVAYLTSVYTAGPAEQYSVYGFTIDGDIYLTKVIGIRVLVFPFMPDWKRGVNLGYAYKTVIATARNGYEQRRSQFASPKRTLSIHMDEGDVTQQKFINYIRTNMARYVACNLYHEIFWTNGTLEGEVDIISAVDLTYFFNLQHLSSKIAIIDPINNIGELKTIDSISGNTVTVTKAISKAFDPTTAVIMPVFTAVINNHGHAHITSAFTSADIKFDEVYLSLGDTSPPSIPATTQTLPSIIVPDMKAGIKRKTMELRDLHEFFGSIPKLLSLNDRRPETFSFRDFINGRQSVYTLENFFCQHRGRLARLWFNAPLNEFELLDSIGSGATLITTRRNGYEYCWSTDDYIYLLLKNGNSYRRRVTDLALDEDNDDLTIYIEGTIPEAVELTDVVYLGRSYLVRFDQDTLTFGFANVEVANVPFRLYELPNERDRVT